MDQQGHGLLQALERLERRAESSASGWRLLLYAVILAPLCIIAPSMFSQRIQGSDLILAAVATIFLATVSYRYSSSTRQELRSALERSNLAQRIAGGELEAAAIRECMPWPWRNLVSDTKNLAPTLMRVANNLDWYLRLPSPIHQAKAQPKLFRVSWLLLPLLPPLIALVSWIDLTGNPWKYDPNRDVTFFPILEMIFATISLSFASLFYYRRQVWHEELARYLRRTLEADEAPDSRADAAPGAGAAPDKAD